jgi:hypothetical protein
LVEQEEDPLCLVVDKFFDELWRTKRNAQLSHTKQVQFICMNDFWGQIEMRQEVFWRKRRRRISNRGRGRMWKEEEAFVHVCSESDGAQSGHKESSSREDRMIVS